MSPQEINTISLSAQTSPNIKSAYAPHEGTATKTKQASPSVDEVYTEDAYSLELSKTQPKEPVDYSKKSVPLADDTAFNDPYPVKVRVPINEVIVVSVKPRQDPPAKENMGEEGLDTA